MDEINELLEKQSELIDKLGAKAKAFDYVLESLTECWEEYISEGELIEEDFRSGEHGGLFRKWNEINIKTKLIREVICFMTQTLEEFRKGENECSE